jgi:hypothetical protein
VPPRAYRREAHGSVTQCADFVPISPQRGRMGSVRANAPLGLPVGLDQIGQDVCGDTMSRQQPWRIKTHWPDDVAQMDESFTDCWRGAWRRTGHRSRKPKGAEENHYEERIPDHRFLPLRKHPLRVLFHLVARRTLIRACQCLFCKKRNGQYTSDSKRKVKIHLQEERFINKYRFATKTADFWICKSCGLLPVVTARIGDTMYAVVNLTTADNLDISQLAAKHVNSSSEDKASREERRKRTWISDVMILQGA